MKYGAEKQTVLFNCMSHRYAHVIVVVSKMQNTELQVGRHMMSNCVFIDCACKAG